MACHIPLTVSVLNRGQSVIKFPKPETYVMPDSVIDLTVTDLRGNHADRLIAGLYRSGDSPTDYIHLDKGDAYKIDLDKAGICNEYETLPSGRLIQRLVFTL